MSFLVGPVVDGLGLRDRIWIVDEAGMVLEGGYLRRVAACLGDLGERRVLVAIQLDDARAGVGEDGAARLDAVGPSVDLVAVGGGVPASVSGRDLRHIVPYGILVAAQNDTVVGSNHAAAGTGHR